MLNNVDGDVQPIGAVLSNLAASCLRTARDREALSAALAATRLFVCESQSLGGDCSGLMRRIRGRILTSLVSLGELEFAREILAAAPESVVSEDVCEIVRMDMSVNPFACLRDKGDEEHADAFKFQEALASAKNPVPLDWVHPDVEIRDAGGKKGRGVFAKRDLAGGTLIMVIKTAGFRKATPGGSNIAHDVSAGVMSSRCQKELLKNVLLRIVDDQTVAWRLSHLFDNTRDFQARWEEANDGVLAKDLPGFRLVADGLSPVSLPGLPPVREFLVDTEKIGAIVDAVTEERLDRVLNINTFGGKKFQLSHTVLYPVASFLNHDSERENCGFLDPVATFLDSPLLSVGLVTTERAVRAGDELVTTYTSGGQSGEKWGLES